MKKLLTLFTLLLCVCSGAWGDETQTIQAGSNSTGPFTYSDLAAWSRSGKWGHGVAIEIGTSGSFTFTNKDGVTITGISISGVAKDSKDRKGTITITDDADTPHSVTTGSQTWVQRDVTEVTPVIITTGIGNLKCDANTVYTVTCSSDKNLGIQIDITYTTSGGGATTYTVTYDVNGGGSCATASATQPTEGAALTLPTPTWDGYTFEGWYNAGSKIEGATYTPTANITLYAKWTDDTEGKLFSYVDGNYGDKFQAFDGSGWVTANATDKSRTFTDEVTGAKFVITNGAWDKKTNAISALAKYIAGSTSMKVVVPTGYKATVNIWYNSYGDSKLLKVDGDPQTAPGSNKLNDSQTNALIYSKLVAVTVTEKNGDVVLTSSGSSDNIYIARVAVTLTHVSAEIGDAGWNTFSSKVALDLSTLSATSEVKAYYASAASDGKVTMSSTDAIVPAGEGLMIKGTVGEVFTIDAATGNGTNIVGNLLEGLPNGGTVAKGANNYVFAWQTGNVSTTAGFYYVNDAEPTLPAGKAYLHTTTPLSGKLNIIIDDSTSQEEETDGIKAVSTNVENGVRYNLAGQKVGANYKGIVIVNGKKVIIK